MSYPTLKGRARGSAVRVWTCDVTPPPKSATVGHQFFNDTGGAYNPAQAEAAYSKLMSWFAAHLD